MVCAAPRLQALPEPDNRHARPKARRWPVASTDMAMICTLAIWTSPAQPHSCSTIRSAPPPDPTHRQDKPVRGTQGPTGIAHWPGWSGAHFPNRTADDSTVSCLMGPGITTSLAHGNRPRRPGYPSAPRTGTLGRTAERQRIQSVRTRAGVSRTVGSFLVFECGELCLARRPHRPYRHVGRAQLDSEFSDVIRHCASATPLVHGLLLRRLN